MNESEKQFSFTRAALSTGGRAKSKFLSVLLVGVCLLTVFVARSQDMAPESLAHKLLSVTIANGLPESIEFNAKTQRRRGASQPWHSALAQS